jgi:hypothetical protein
MMLDTRLVDRDEQPAKQNIARIDDPANAARSRAGAWLAAELMESGRQACRGSCSGGR